MATKKKETEKELEVGEIVSRSEQFIEKHKNYLLYGIVAIAAIVGIILGYHYGYAKPKGDKAILAIYKAEQYFDKDSFALALHGNGINVEGFEDIIDQYGGTKSGNLAKAYAGVCYYKLGDPETAIKRLKSFNANDDQISPVIIGLIGDCYVSTGNTKEGISYFEKAASKADNTIISPIYLKKAGIAYESLNQYNDAIKVYTQIKDKYNRSLEASDIDKYIARAEILSKQ